MRLTRRDGGHEARARLALTRRVTMKTEDEVYLSAYLDGELDLDKRSTVESALLSNPALAERLRELTAVRDLVAGLPRPALQDDLAPVILARISGRTSSPRRSPSPARLLLAAAALVLVAVGLNLIAPRHRPPAQNPDAPPSIVAAPTQPPTALARTDAASERAPLPPSVTPRATIAPQPVASDRAVARRDEADLAAEREQQRVRELLDSPDLKHVFIVVDELGGDLPDRVEGLVRNTPRIEPSFGKITVSQGIVIDPKHPNQATVYALVMDQNEVAQFRDRLTNDLHTRFDETDADASVVTQLTGIGQVAVLPGTRATELAAAPADSTSKTAIRSSQHKNGEMMLQSSPEFDGLPVRVVVEQRPTPASRRRETVKPEVELEPSGGAESTGGGLSELRADSGSVLPPPSVPRDRDPADAAPAATRPTAIVLVWVTTRDPVPSGAPPAPDQTRK